MYHTSPIEIKDNMINYNGIAGDCLFFSNDIYFMTSSKDYYVYEAEFNCITSCKLYNEDIINDIVAYFNCDAVLAECLLDGSGNEYSQNFDVSGSDSWWLQGKRGECAKLMGFDGCIDEDEQGLVYIIPMHGRENELKLIEHHIDRH